MKVREKREKNKIMKKYRNLEKRKKEEKTVKRQEKLNM